MEKKNSVCIYVTFLLLTVVFLRPAAYAQQEEIAEVLRGCSEAVVSIVAYDSSKKEISQGKGVIVSSDGLILTNYHLVSQAHSAKVRLVPSGKARKKIDWEDVFYPGYKRKGAGRTKKGKWIKVAGVVSFDKNLDFALLKIGKKGYSASQLALSDQFEIGDRVYIFIDEGSVYEATISGLKEMMGMKKIVQSNFSFSSDMSGSPLFNAQGKVIGIASYITENSNVIFPASYALPLIKKGKGTPLSKFSHEDYFVTAEGLYLKGTAYSLAQNYIQSLTHFEESLQKNPRNPDAFSQLGFLNSKLRRFEKAVEAYRNAFNLNSSDYKTAFGMGMAYTKLNQYQNALSPLVQCTRINPDFPDAFYNLGLAYETLGQLEKAAGAYQRFIEINPGPAWTGFNQLGGIYAKMGQYDKAIAAFQEVMKTNPSDLKATYNLAYAYDMTGRYDQAAQLYRKLISVNPKDANAYNSLLFRLYDKAGQYNKAIEVCLENIKQSPDSLNDHYNLAIMYTKMDNYEKALEAFGQVLSMNPNFDQAIYNTAIVYFTQKKYLKAIDAFNTFAKLKPDQPDAHYYIGTGYLLLKKYDKAIKPLQRTIELKPDYARAHYNAGIAYYAVRDRFSADEEYKTLLKLDSELAKKLSKIIHKK